MLTLSERLASIGRITGPINTTDEQTTDYYESVTDRQ
jgi:hypothetical protein